MENNSKIDEQIKQYEEFINKIEDEEFINKIEDDIININGIPTSKFENIEPNSTGFGGKYNMGVNPCEHCHNNPKNNPFSSGICHCALPALTNIIS